MKDKDSQAPDQTPLGLLPTVKIGDWHLPTWQTDCDIDHCITIMMMQKVDDLEYTVIALDRRIEWYETAKGKLDGLDEHYYKNSLKPGHRDGIHRMNLGIPYHHADEQLNLSLMTCYLYRNLALSCLGRYDIPQEKLKRRYDESPARFSASPKPWSRA